MTVHVGAFAVVYGIFLSFGEFGPGNCLGMLAAKTGPTAIRGQFYGIAAAMGKIGAFAGTWAFPRMIDGEHVLSLFVIAAEENTHSVVSVDFGGASSERGNTGPFWVGSGMSLCFVACLTECLFTDLTIASFRSRRVQRLDHVLLHAPSVDGLHEEGRC